MENQFDISEVQIFPIRQQESLVGFTSFVMSGLKISGVALHTNKEGGLRLVYPARKVGEGHQFYCTPINSEIGEIIRMKIEQKAEEVGLFHLGEEFV